MNLEVKDLYKSFGKTEVLHGINLYVESGRPLGLLGRNGAGKTTTIRIIMDLFSGNSGEILLDGKKFIPKNHKIGYLPEERGLYPKKKTLEQLIYLGELRGFNKKEVKEDALYWFKRLGIEEYKDKKLETLSKGNQQKVQLASVFLGRPEIIILDEPFSGLDPINSQILKDIIFEIINDNRILIFSSHQMNYVEEFCEEIALIDKGDIVLSGDLNRIKEEYGKDRLTISIVDLQSRDLKDIFIEKFKDIAHIVETRKDYLIIELLDGKSKKDLLEKIIELDLDIDMFSNYKPKLSDIFVERVGDK
ncbi:ABC transporter ATP-binding protein [Tissierella creatinophila]|uniref:Putative ABC transporter ATP-binding protein YxlF n=1 Tax=Tissierella creatinophila DSM 6911 TaxID=1123403 RepID=A0A1U7M2P3_TISCR|nr:ATP-binding cassette domain-containing protein [Tissierella creatinophila]OLS01520.1 putative ABC transporter ATP-binding protein YxlF [Tissierella creatinophila DSM 6911]